MRRAVTTALAVSLLAGCAGPGQEPAPRGEAQDPAVAVAACLREKGWDVTAHPDNSVSASYPDEQHSQYLADAEFCDSLVRPGEPPPPMTAAQAGEYFDGLLEAADCVRGLGYQVDEPPSRQSAVQALQQPVIDLGWDPYESVTLGASSQDEIDEVHRQCPQPPWPS